MVICVLDIDEIIFFASSKLKTSFIYPLYRIKSNILHTIYRIFAKGSK